MSGESPVERGERLSMAAAIRERALTVEQRERRAWVERRTAVISAGVKPPASGIFGRPKGAKS